MWLPAAKACYAMVPSSILGGSTFFGRPQNYFLSCLMYSDDGYQAIQGFDMLQRCYNNNDAYTI